MIVKIIDIDEKHRIASACMASNWFDYKKDKPKMSIKITSKRGWSPKKGHSYSVNPCHEWHPSKRGHDLVHGNLEESKSMEEDLVENYHRKNR